MTYLLRITYEYEDIRDLPCGEGSVCILGPRSDNVQNWPKKPGVAKPTVASVGINFIVALTCIVQVVSHVSGPPNLVEMLNISLRAVLFSSHGC